LVRKLERLRPLAGHLAPIKKRQLLIIAGANGSGKSTAYTDTRIIEDIRALWIINPDLLTRHIQEIEGKALPEANLAAVRRMMTWLRASIRCHVSIGLETVLSTDKYRPLVRMAKRRGFEVKLIYVVLNSPALNIARVKRRVKAGGHDVPEQKIISRRAKSLAQLPWFLAKADYALIIDNSQEAGTPVTIVQKKPAADGFVVEFDPLLNKEIGGIMQNTDWDALIRSR